MTDTAMLDNLISSSGYKYSFVAKQLNISYQALRNKIDNKSEFLPTEIEKLCELLKIKSLKLKNRVFFAKFDE